MKTLNLDLTVGSDDGIYSSFLKTWLMLIIVVACLRSIQRISFRRHVYFVIIWQKVYSTSQIAPDILLLWKQYMQRRRSHFYYTFNFVPTSFPSLFAASIFLGSPSPLPSYFCLLLLMVINSWYFLPVLNSGQHAIHIWNHLLNPVYK